VKLNFSVGEILVKIAPEDSWLPKPTIKIQFVPL
jgi:hypothetical protein